jgi:hypothetical protein
MNKAIGRQIAAGNVAEIFEFGTRVAKIYKRTAAKPAAFCEAAIHSAVEAIGLPVPRVWSVQQFGDRWGIVFDRVKQASFAEQMSDNPGETSAHLNCLVRLHSRRTGSPASRPGSRPILLRPDFCPSGRSRICCRGLLTCQRAIDCATATFTR